MKWNSFWTTMVLVLVMSSCGKKTGEKKKAPRTQQDAGIIASCTSRAEAEGLSEKLGISYRVISDKRKLIEYIGISEQELRKHLPRSNFKVNTVFVKPLVEGTAKVQDVPNEPYYGAHNPEYGNRNRGRFYPHLDQIAATSLEVKGEDVKIAVIDTGVYYNHPHLSPNILTNSADPHGRDADGEDNDENGFQDDYVGWDFYNNDPYPIDDHGHGTHVAGLAASTLSGVAPKAKILPIKVLGSDGRGDLGTIAAGILYAIDRGAHIINMSLGGDTGGLITSEIKDMINAAQFAKRKDVLIIAAAGNGGFDGIGDCNDNSPVYPANIEEENVISVASVDLYNSLTEYSNFGGASVDIAAPGGDYYTGGLSSTTIPFCLGRCTEDDAEYELMSGTSMATPVVAGVAALIKSKFPKLSFAQIKEKIMKQGTKISELEGLIRSESVVNASNALR